MRRRSPRRGLIQMIGDMAGVKAIVVAGSFAGLAIVIGCFFVLGWSRQALHDTLAGTAVFKKRDLRAPAPQGFEVVTPNPDPLRRRRLDLDD